MELKFLSICYFHINFHLSTTIEVGEMYENFTDMVPKIAICFFFFLFFLICE